MSTSRTRRHLLASIAAGAVCGTARFAQAGAAASVRVELPMLSRNGEPAVDVTVNGQGPFRFAIDTGAQGRARADTRLVQALSLPKVGEARGSDPSGRNAVAMDIVRLDRLALGGLVFTDVDAPSRDYNRPGPGSRSEAPFAIDGILGFALFAEHLLTLDFANRQVRLETGSLRRDAPDVVPFTMPRGVPLVQLTVAGEKAEAHVDTGNQVAAVMLPEDLAARLPMQDEPRVVGRARTVSNSFEIKEARLRGDVALGPLLLARPLVRFPSPAREVNLGAAAWAGRAVTFDQRHGLMRIAGG